jgi:transposase
MAKPILDDNLWALVEPLLRPQKSRRKRSPGRKPIDPRKALTGILFVLKTGIGWEYLPQEMGCGSGMTCWRRLRDWNAAGVWDKIHRMLLERLHNADKLDWSRAVIDSSSIRAVLGGSRPEITRTHIGPEIVPGVAKGWLTMLSVKTPCRTRQSLGDRLQQDFQ